MQLQQDLILGNPTEVLRSASRNTSVVETTIKMQAFMQAFSLQVPDWYSSCPHSLLNTSESMHSSKVTIFYSNSFKNELHLGSLSSVGSWPRWVLKLSVVWYNADRCGGISVLLVFICVYCISLHSMTLIDDPLGTW